MAHKRWFLMSYLIAALLYGIGGLLDGILVILQEVSNAYLITVSIIALLFFLFNIMAMAWFHYHHVPDLAHFFPFYHIVIYLTFFMLGLIPALGGFLTYFGLILSVGEIVFVFYIFAKLKLISSHHRRIFRTKSWEPPKFS